MKTFGSGDAPFLAPNGDIPEGSPEELNRPTNQFFNNVYGSIKRVIESAGMSLTPVDGTDDDIGRLKDAIRQHARDIVSEQDHKNSVRAVITSSSVALSGIPSSVNADGVTLADGDRVLRAVTPADAANGIYVVSSSGAWARATDANESAEVTSGMEVAVEEGALYKDSKWTLTTDGAIVLGATTLLFSMRFGSAQNLVDNNPSTQTVPIGLTVTAATLTVIVSGVYDIIGYARLASTAAGYTTANVALRVNGTVLAGTETGENYTSPAAGTACRPQTLGLGVLLSAGDVVTLTTGASNSAAALTKTEAVLKAFWRKSI